MIGGLIYFLFGCLALAVVIYVVKLLLGMMDLTPEVRKIALLIVGLIGLLILLGLAFGGMGGLGWR